MASNSDVILFENGLVWQWTQNDSEAKRANWFTVLNNKFENIGFGDPPQDIRKSATSTFDLSGKLVLPGLHDSHIHVYSMGECLQYVDLNGCTSIDELKTRVQKHASDFPDSKWILGVGWEQDMLSSDSKYPTRYDLDEVVSDRPIYLSRACWHIAVVNTKAMEVAGMNLQRNDLDISNGVVDVDQNGVPTGVLREDARSLIMEHIQESSDGKSDKYILCHILAFNCRQHFNLSNYITAVRSKYLISGLRQCLQFGLTGISIEFFSFCTSVMCF